MGRPQYIAALNKDANLCGTAFEPVGSALHALDETEHREKPILGEVLDPRDQPKLPDTNGARLP